MPDPSQERLVADPGNQQDDPPSTKSQKRSPMLIVPKDWDVPIHQRMVDIFAVAKTGASEPPRSAPEVLRPEGPQPDCPPDPEGPGPACLQPDCPPDSEGPGPACLQPDCPPEPEGNGTVEKMEIDAEPPVVLRVEQWKLKPAGRGRGRGKGRGGRGRGKACTGEIMVESSAAEIDEGDVDSKVAVPSVDGDAGKKSRRKPKAKAKPKAKSSSSRKRPSTAEVSTEIEASGDKVKEEGFFKFLLYLPHKYICT